MGKELQVNETGGAISTTFISESTIDEFLFGTGTQLNDQQKAFFIGYCKERNLNPFKGEAYPVPYKNKKTGKYELSVITGYEVYLRRAEATGKLQGWNVQLIGTPENFKNIKAKIIIHREDFEQPFCWTVHMFEYEQSNSFWRTMPYTMIRKVCIGQGMRMCFPNATRDLPYMTEEMPESAIDMGKADRVDTKKEGSALSAIEHEDDLEPTYPPLEADDFESEEETTPENEPEPEKRTEQKKVSDKQSANTEEKNLPKMHPTEWYCCDTDLRAFVGKEGKDFKVFLKAGSNFLPYHDAPGCATKKSMVEWLNRSKWFEVRQQEI